MTDFQNEVLKNLDKIANRIAESGIDPLSLTFAEAVYKSASNVEEQLKESNRQLNAIANVLGKIERVLENYTGHTDK